MSTKFGLDVCTENQEKQEQQKKQWERELFGRVAEEGLRFCTLFKEEMAKILFKKHSSTVDNCYLQYIYKTALKL